MNKVVYNNRFSVSQLLLLVTSSNNVPLLHCFWDTATCLWKKSLRDSKLPWTSPHFIYDSGKR